MRTPPIAAREPPPPPPPPVEATPTEDDLQAIYRWSAQTKRSVAGWKREESRFLWPLISFFVVSIGASLGFGAIFATEYFRYSTALILTILWLNFVTPVAAGVLIYLFFRSRDRRLNQQDLEQLQAVGPLPGNLIEASLLELEATDSTLSAIGRRIGWTVFLACWLGLVVAEFSVSISELLYTTVTHISFNPFAGPWSFAFYYGLIGAIAGLFIAANAVYWRRVQRRLKELRTATDRRREALAALEQSLWKRV